MDRIYKQRRENAAYWLCQARNIKRKQRMYNNFDPEWTIKNVLKYMHLYAKWKALAEEGRWKTEQEYWNANCCKAVAVSPYQMSQVDAV